MAPATATQRPAQWGQPVPDGAAQELRELTEKIEHAENVMDERARLYDDLHRRGYSFEAIAQAAGVTREAVRKSVLRWRRQAEGRAVERTG